MKSIRVVFLVLFAALLLPHSAIAGDEVLVQEIAGKINKEYPKHGMKSWQLERFIQGSRTVADIYHMHDKDEQVRFVMISWKIGTPFVRKPWAKKILEDPTLEHNQDKINQLERAYVARAVTLKHTKRSKK